jgi:hypothetical protein
VRNHRVTNCCDAVNCQANPSSSAGVSGHQLHQVFGAAMGYSLPKTSQGWENSMWGNRQATMQRSWLDMFDGHHRMNPECSTALSMRVLVRGSRRAMCNLMRRSGSSNKHVRFLINTGTARQPTLFLVFWGQCFSPNDDFCCPPLGLVRRRLG